MKEVKIVSIADIHGNLLTDLPTGHILTISGDICPVDQSHHPTHQAHWLMKHFFPWCEDLIKRKVFRHVVYTPGNHDFVFQHKKRIDPSIKIVHPKKVHCLIDQTVKVLGVTIHGTPWSIFFGNWAFMTSETFLANKYLDIPEGVDILLSHSPAHSLNDMILQYPDMCIDVDPRLGSKSLYDRIKVVKPKKVLVGHIHSGNHGVVRVPTNIEFTEYIESVNVSILDEDYKVAYKPYQFTIIKE